ncbi:MAG: EthD family reductase [Bacteroidota bacterium]
MNTKIKLLVLLLGLASGLSINNFNNTEHNRKGMIKMAIYYPSGEGNTFDMEYYSTKHMPMAADLFGASLKAMEIDKGLTGATPELPAPYMAIGYFYFENLETFQKALGAHSATLRADVPNYTNVKPEIQISEVQMAK